MRKKREFSKVILVVAFYCAVLLTIGSFVLMWRTGDLSPLSYLIPGVFAVITAATSFYFWKAKNENILKIQKENSDLASRLREVLENELDY